MRLRIKRSCDTGTDFRFSQFMVTRLHVITEPLFAADKKNWKAPQPKSPWNLWKLSHFTSCSIRTPDLIKLYMNWEEYSLDTDVPTRGFSRFSRASLEVEKKITLLFIGFGCWIFFLLLAGHWASVQPWKSYAVYLWCGCLLSICMALASLSRFCGSTKYSNDILVLDSPGKPLRNPRIQ